MSKELYLDRYFFSYPSFDYPPMLRVTCRICVWAYYACLKITVLPTLDREKAKYASLILQDLAIGPAWSKTPMNCKRLFGKKPGSLPREPLLRLENGEVTRLMIGCFTSDGRMVGFVLFRENLLCVKPSPVEPPAGARFDNESQKDNLFSKVCRRGASLRLTHVPNKTFL